MTTWFNETSIEVVSAPSQEITNTKIEDVRTLRCPSCGHTIQLHDQTTILHDFPGLPAGVKFDPSDQEILEHLEAKALTDRRKLHPLIDEFIPTIDGENGICYTHPDKLPGVSKDGQIRHFFHRPSKAYTTGTRKRRKVHTDADGGETRWHKTGKTRPVFAVGILKGYKKILVLYTNYGRQRKPEKTNWVMHQYHLGSDEEEKDGEFVVSKVFYQTQPRQSNNTNVKEIEKRSSKSKSLMLPRQEDHSLNNMDPNFMEYYGSPQYIDSPTQLIPNMVVHGHGGGSSFVHLASTASKGK